MGTKIKFGKCPKCRNREDIEVKEVTPNSAMEAGMDEVEAFRLYQARCPKCGYYMRRSSLLDLRDGWRQSKEKRVKHVSDCINGIPSVVYPGGCAYIGPDTVEMWRDEDGSLAKLQKYLNCKVGRITKLAKLSDGVGMIIYCDKSVMKDTKINSFVAGLTQ